MNISAARYFPNLDSLRGIAAMLVVFHHIALWLPFSLDVWGSYARILLSGRFTFGGVGVQFFFVLSGFLITFRMLQERGQTQTFNLLGFYNRRIRRIIPLYMLSLLIGFGLWQFYSQKTEAANPLMYLFFLANFDHIYNHLPNALVLGVQWSVAIEEQFYLVYPLIFIIFRGKSFVLFLLLIIASSLIFNYWYIDNNLMSYFHTFSVGWFLGIGAVGAYFAFFYTNKLLEIFNKGGALLVNLMYSLGIVCLLCPILLVQLNVQMLFLLKIILAFCFLFLILEQCFYDKAHTFGTWRWLRWLGKISYGIYLLHIVVIVLVLEFNKYFYLPIFLQVALVLSCTIGFAALSFNYFESFFLKKTHNIKS